MPSIGGMSAGTAWINVLPDTKMFGPALARDMTKSSSGISNVGKAIGKTLAIGVGAGLVGVGILIKGALEEAQEALQIEAQTAAVLKSTGGAAKITGREIDKLTGRIQGYAAISDETVREGANMLLTFKNIRNEAGANNDIFTQSTEALTDMSVAMGKDMPSSAIMLGKALNDPIKGLAAMSRVGIQFTKGQENQITAMVDANNVMGAQKVILKELESQFGGSARAVGDTKPWEKLKLAIGEIQEGIGKALMPTINEFAKDITKFTQSEEFQAWIKDASRWLSEELPKAIDFTADAFRFMARNAETLAKVVGGTLTFAFGVKLLRALSAVRASMATLGLAKLATGVGTGAAAGGGGVGLLAKAGPWPAVAAALALMVKQAVDADAKIADLTKTVERFGLKSDRGADAAGRAADEVRSLGASSLGLDNTFGNVNAKIEDVNQSLADANRRFKNASLGTEEFNDVMERARDITGEQRQRIGQLITRVVNLQGPLNDNIKSQLRTNLYWGEGKSALEKLREELHRAENSYERSRKKVDEHAEGIHTLDWRVRNLGVEVDKNRGKFDAWARSSRDNVQSVTDKIGNLTDQIQNATGMSRININANLPMNDGFGVPGSIGGKAVSWANAAINAVPGPQYISSSFRPGAITASGNRSYHADASNPAADISGPLDSSGTFIYGDAIANYLRRFAYRELLWRVPDHYDHVHVAKQGWHGWVDKATHFLAGEAGRERVDITPRAQSGPPTVIVEIHPKRGMEGIERFIDVRVRDGIKDNQRYLESRQRVSR